MKFCLQKCLFVFVLSASVCVPFAAQGSGNNIDFGKYDFGKKVFLERVVCTDCPFPNEYIGNDKLWRVATMLKPDGEIGKNLSQRDRDSALYYLSARSKVEPKS